MAADLVVWVTNVNVHDDHPFSDWSQAADHTCTAWIATLPNGFIFTLDMAPISTRLPGSRSEIEASAACQVWWLLPIDYSFVSGWKRTHCRSCGPFLLLEDHIPWPLDLSYDLEATHDATMVLTVFQAIVSWSMHAIWTIKTNLCLGFAFFYHKSHPTMGQWSKYLLSISCSLLSIDFGYYWTLKEFLFLTPSPPSGPHTSVRAQRVYLQKRIISSWQFPG